MNRYFFSLLIIATTLFACGKKESNTQNNQPQQVSEGIFMTIKRPGQADREDVKATFVPGGWYIEETGVTRISAYIPNTASRIEIEWKNGTSTGSLTWSKSDFPDFLYKDLSNKMYYEYYSTTNLDTPPSPGELKITSYGEVGGYIIGEFTLSKAGESGTTNTIEIVGTFKVKRQK